MCGIFGIIGLNARVPADVLERATRSLAHRGPDDSGTVILRDSVRESIEIGLGNRRLAILDLSPLGHQPMNDPATGNWIVYNGEIYNFREVRTKLERKGVYFGSHSDTEVILKAYARWGEECLHEFRGMFAFAIWDAQRHRLFVARDPMGIKPLYYYRSDQYFIFSSEVRTLLGTGLVPRRIDPAGLVSYLSFGSLYDPNTLVEGVNALPPGCWLTWEKGQVKPTQYWDLVDADLIERSQRAAHAGAVRRGELETQVAEMLDESVRMQLVSDVPVGVFLSGGIDSSSLVGILNRNGVRPNTFSIVFQEADYSEAEYSRAIAQQFRTEHHEITVSQADFFAAIAPAIHAMDLPTIDGINTYFVSERTRAAGVKVALSGLGGDEMFAGYSSFRTVPRMERFANAWDRIPQAVRNPLANAFSLLAPANDQNRKLTALARDGGRIVHPYFLSRMLFTPDQQSDLLPWVQTDSAAIRRAQIPLTDSLSRAQGLDPVNRVSYLEARCYMLNTLLRDSDFMSMAHGLEVRVPLIDHQLARRILALLGSWKLDGAMPKPLLVRALGGQLPEKIVHRPKRGFTLPFEHWLRDELRPVLEEALGKIGDGPLASLISQPAARRVWSDFLEGRTSWSRPWSLYVLQCWCQQHLSQWKTSRKFGSS
jgi:asparagine synthase (glutamine-hydrolysing)